MEKVKLEESSIKLKANENIKIHREKSQNKKLRNKLLDQRVSLSNDFIKKFEQRKRLNVKEQRNVREKISSLKKN